MAQLKYADTPTINTSGSGAAGDPVVSAVIPLGTARALVNDTEALETLRAAVDTVNVNAVVSLNGDVITVTPGDGTDPYDLTITHPAPPPETDGVHVDGAVPPVWDFPARTITWQTVNDADETAGAPLVDTTIIPALMAVIAAAQADLVGAGSATADYDAAANTWVVTATDTDTVCTFSTLPDGCIEKSAQVYVDGAPVGAPVVTKLGLPFWDLLMATLADPFKAALVKKLLFVPVPVTGPIATAEPDGGYVEGDLYFDVDGLEKLEVAVIENGKMCLKPYGPLRECMCISLDDGRFFDLDADGCWKEKPEPEPFITKSGVDECIAPLVATLTPGTPEFAALCESIAAAGPQHDDSIVE